MCLQGTIRCALLLAQLLIKARRAFRATSHSVIIFSNSTPAATWYRSTVRPRDGQSRFHARAICSCIKRSVWLSNPTCRYVVSVNWSAEMVKAALAQEGLNVVVAGASC